MFVWSLYAPISTVSITWIYYTVCLVFVNHRNAVSATSPVSTDPPWCVYVTVTNAKLIIRVDGAVSLCVTEGRSRKCCNYCVNMFDVTLRVHPFGNFQLGVELVRV